jgi:hypothetical protein
MNAENITKTKTKNRIKKMKTYNPTEKWTTPPENQGQIVTVSYSLDYGAEVILESIYDASDRSQEYRAYAYPDDDDGSWEPWNGVPRLGRELGRCEISQAKDEAE